jgi:uncharacterized protein YwqG
MTVEEIKNKLSKKAVEFSTGGFKPTNTDTESWIGRVYLYKQDETIPPDNNGDLMFPLFQLCLSNLPFTPNALSKTKVITVFISEDYPKDLSANGDNWLLREYFFETELLIKDLTNQASHIKPFPLKPKLIKNDYPVWDGGGIPGDIEDEILKLENGGIIESYYDIVENHYLHKVGGYPSFCQPGIDFGDGFEFVLQISSDEKADLNIVDSGTIFLAKSVKTSEWKFYCDFY